MPEETVPGAAPVDVRRIRFVRNPAPGAEILAEFPVPCPAYAISEPVSFDALPPPSDASEPVDILYFVFLPGGSAVPYDMQQKAAEWMAKPPVSGAVPTVEAVIRSDRVLWRPGRAMLQGAADRRDECLAGIVHFAFYEAELRKLENELDEDWPGLELDLKLTAEVRGDELSQWPRVNEMTRRAGARRIRHSSLERRLEKPSLSLPPPAQRIVSEFILQTETADRLKTADERIEVMEELYATANDRLSEFSYFRRELRAEIWVIVLLVAEVILMIYEIALTLKYH